MTMVATLRWISIPIYVAFVVFATLVAVVAIVGCAAADLATRER